MESNLLKERPLGWFAFWLGLAGFLWPAAALFGLLAGLLEKPRTLHGKWGAGLSVLVMHTTFSLLMEWNLWFVIGNLLMAAILIGLTVRDEALKTLIVRESRWTWIAFGSITFFLMLVYLDFVYAYEWLERLDWYLAPILLIAAVWSIRMGRKEIDSLFSQFLFRMVHAIAIGSVLIIGFLFLLFANF